MGPVSGIGLTAQIAVLLGFVAFVDAEVRGCCKDATVKAGILPATREPWWKFHENEVRCEGGRPCSEAQCKACWSGLVPDLHQRLSELMGYEYELVSAPPGSTDEDLLRLLESDAVTLLPHELGPLSFTKHLKANFTFSQPFVSFTYSALVRTESRSSGVWSLFTPFAPTVWAVILVFFLIFALLFWALEGPVLKVYDFVRAVDFVAASTLGGMEYEGVRSDGGPGRFVRIGMLFFVLIVTVTYTANLASILTANKAVVEGPRDMKQLKTATVCSFDRPTVRMSISEHARVVETPAGSPTEWEATRAGRSACLDKLFAKEVDGVVANVLELKQMQRDFGHCHNLEQIQAISFNPRYVTFVAANRNAAFIQNITEGIVELQTNKLLVSLMEENYESLCTKPSSEDDQIKLEHLGGLFLITAGFIACGLVAFVALKLAGRGAGQAQVHDVTTSPSLRPTQGGNPLQTDLLRTIASDVRSLKAQATGSSVPRSTFEHDYMT